MKLCIDCKHLWVEGSHDPMCLRKSSPVTGETLSVPAFFERGGGFMQPRSSDTHGDTCGPYAQFFIAKEPAE